MEFGRPGQKVARFGLYEADVRQRVLTKGGLKVRLQDQPFQVLALLLERPGELVTREEIQQKLWPADTYVAFDDGLNTAIKKLRSALSDTADNPRFIETVPRRGYRFVAPVNILPVPQLATGNQRQTEPSSSFQVPETSTVDTTPVAAERLRPGRVRYVWLAFGGLLLAGGIATYLHLRAPSFRVTPSDTIVLADFVNTTGETVFDTALREATEVGLQQSPYLNIVPDRKTAAILTEMRRGADDHMTGNVAIEVCQRAGGKVTVQGSISSIGTTYLVGLAAIRCDNGAPIAREEVEARRKEDVVDALGNATSRLRARLGESMPSIQKYDVPLVSATTPSLDALRAYGQALSALEKSGDLAAVPFFKRAIELDPNFALAYGTLADIYWNLGEAELARQNAIKAYELRDRVTDLEKLSIETGYRLYVTGEREKAVDAFEIARRTYPVSSRFLNDLGVVYGSLGRFDQEIAIYRESLRAAPSVSTIYGNLAVSLMALGKIDEAGTVLSEAARRNLESDYLLQVNYWREFLRGNSDEMKRILLRSLNVPGAQSLLLSEQANTEAYFGHFEKARQLSNTAAKLMQNEGQKEAAGLCLAQAAVREAEIGDYARARDLIYRAQHLTHNQNVLTLTALVMVQIGDFAKGHVLAGKLDKQYPSSTFIQKYWLPVIGAVAELRQNQGTKAVNLLSPVEPLDSAAPDEFPTGTLYPAYVRGQAYLVLDDGSKAEAEFQKLLDHRGVVLNFPLGALARLGQARAYACRHDSLRAHNAYRDFLQLWKDADSNLPTFKRAKAEYAALR
jgi:DNA-binding winged helix-turn-helix (wHTH) protein/tetratricopeptide (TPR) repeat protein